MPVVMPHTLPVVMPHTLPEVMHVGCGACIRGLWGMHLRSVAHGMRSVEHAKVWRMACGVRCMRMRSVAHAYEECGACV